jgi:hypothetical protein
MTNHKPNRNRIVQALGSVVLSQARLQVNVKVE